MMALMLLVSLNASATANKTCAQISALSERYAIYGAIKLKSVVAVIENDNSLPAHLKKIITDSYIFGANTGASITTKQRETVRVVAKDKCLAYLLP